MFSQACVISSVHGGEGGFCPGGSDSGGLHPGGWADPPIEYYGIRSRAGGTHPTEMHSCVNSKIDVDKFFV